MEKTIMFAVMLWVFLFVTGCTTERYAEYMKDCPAGIDTLSMATGQDVVSLSQSKDHYYLSSYKLFFANADPPSMMKKHNKDDIYLSSYMRFFAYATPSSPFNKQTKYDKDDLYPSSYRLFFAYATPSSAFNEQGAASQSDDRYNSYYYPRTFRRLFAN